MKRLLLPIITLMSVAALSILVGGRIAHVSVPQVVISEYVLPGLYIIFWFSAAWVLKRCCDRLILSLSALTEEAPKFLMDIVGVGLFAAAIVCIISFVFKRPISGLLTTSGLVVAILGLALQSTFANIFSGMALSIAHPFRTGDWLVLNSGETAQVTEFNWREARLETIEGKTVVVPNGQLASQQFTNLNSPERYYRVKEPIYVDYSAPPERVLSILEAAAKATDGIVLTKPSVVLMEGCYERGVKYTVNFWVPDYPQSFGIRNRLLPTALNYLNQAGLAPSYPKHDVRLQEVPASEIQRHIDVATFLRRVPLFECLNNAALERLEQNARVVEVEAEEVVVREQEPGESLFVVVTGLLEITRRAANGTVQKLGHRAPGEVLGEMSLLTGAARNATVTALTPGSLLEISKSHLEPIFHNSPELMVELSEIQAQRLEAQVSLLVSNTPDSDSDKAQRRRSLRENISRFFHLN